MKLHTRATAASYLAGHGLPAAEITKVLGGFEFGRPVYEHHFWPNDDLYQFVRLSSASDRSPSAGNWFGLAGVTPSGVAINEGLAGRQLVRFKVVAPFDALEGTAAACAVDLGTAIGGKGGSTQVYVPRALIGHLRSAGPADRW